MSRPRLHAATLRFLLFGFLLAFFSSFGQTFFIALFSADFRATYHLTHGSFGAIYSGATLLSGVFMIWLGAQLDRLDLRFYCLSACLGLALACVVQVFATNLLLFAAALFLLRLTGQGLLSHAAMTSMARHFHSARGRAVAFATLGHPASEALLPTIAVGSIAWIGWRHTWLAAALTILLVAVPLVLVLLRGHGRDDEATELGISSPPNPFRLGVAASAGLLFRDRRFAMMIPALTAPGFILTGVFFHQVHLTEVKGWDLSLFASAFIAFAGASVSATTLCGFLVDRLGAVRLMPFYLLPLGLACALLAVSDHPVAIFAYMLLAGATTGGAATITTSMWAEVYGTSHLGGIRSIAVSLMVAATAAAPGGMGWLIDGGTSMDTILLGCTGFVAIATALLFATFLKNLIHRQTR